MHSDEVGVVHTWYGFETDPAFTARALWYFVIGIIAWAFVFCVLGRYPPIPAHYMKNCNEYDKNVVAHRVSCLYHGVI